MIKTLKRLSLAIVVAFFSHHGFSAEPEVCSSIIKSISPSVQWPVVPTEMIEALRAMAQTSHPDREHFPDLSLALSETNGDKIIHALYGDTPLERTEGLRAILATAVGSIKSDELKEKWIRFLIKDPGNWTKNHAAVNYQTFASQAKRDAFARELLDSNDLFLKMAGASGLASVTPTLRWILIQNAIIDKSPEVRDKAIKALSSFSKQTDPELDPQTVLLRAWAKDMGTANELTRYVFGYDPRSQDDEVSSLDVETEHDFSVREIWSLLNSIQNQDLKLEWFRRIESFERDEESPLHKLGEDILIRAKMEEALRAPSRAETRDTVLQTLQSIARLSPYLQHAAVEMLETFEREREEDAKLSSVVPSWNTDEITQFEGHLAP